MYCFYFCVLVLIAAFVLRRKLAHEGRPTERYVLAMLLFAVAGSFASLAVAIAFVLFFWGDEPTEETNSIVVGAMIAGPALGIAAGFWLVHHLSPQRLTAEESLAADYDEPEHRTPADHSDTPLDSPCAPATSSSPDSPPSAGRSSARP